MVVSVVVDVVVVEVSVNVCVTVVPVAVVVDEVIVDEVIVDVHTPHIAGHVSVAKANSQSDLWIWAPQVGGSQNPPQQPGRYVVVVVVVPVAVVAEVLVAEDVVLVAVVSVAVVDVVVQVPHSTGHECRANAPTPPGPSSNVQSAAVTLVPHIAGSAKSSHALGIYVVVDMVVDEKVVVVIVPHIARLASTQFPNARLSHSCELEFIRSEEKTSCESVHFSKPIHASKMMRPASKLHEPPWYPPVHDPTGFPMLANPTSLISCPNSHSKTIVFLFASPPCSRRRPSSIQEYVSGMSYAFNGTTNPAILLLRL